MRLLNVLILGILIYLTVAEDIKRKSGSKIRASTTKLYSTSSIKPEEKLNKGQQSSPTIATGRSNVKTTKATKTAINKDDRTKRTLYDFGNAGYLYSEVANKRSDHGRYYDPYLLDHNAISGGHYLHSNTYGPQYLEPPEPIIEIIIKDSNETSVPILTPTNKTKKKKEKVNVYYVNYKKDKNNKLHLESPIASLNNDDHETEEPEEEVHYSQPVTSLPPLKSTTLRTVIHPDSEKYHSNSGIHVTFGSADKSQIGHQFEENNSESIQREVVAVPASNHVGAYNNFAHFSHNPQHIFNSVNQHNIKPTSSIPATSINTWPYQSQQQLPNQYLGTFFRPPLSAQQMIKNQVLQYPTQQFLKPLPAQRQPQTSANKPFNFVPPQLQSLPQYYVNYNQQYQSFPSQQIQFYNNQGHKLVNPPKTSAVINFPTVPSKQQELPSRQPPVAYQPIKFRPTLASPPSQIKSHTKLETPQYNINKSFKYQKPTPGQGLAAQHHPLAVAPEPYPQFHNHYTTSITHTQNIHQQQQKQTQQHYVAPQAHHHQQYLANVNYKNTQDISANQQTLPPQQQYHHRALNTYNPQTSKVTELLQSIPRFEQHITETVSNNYQVNQAYNSQNQGIHDIPAPNLSLNPNSQQQKEFTAANAALAVKSSQIAESNNGQKVVVVTPVPPITPPQNPTQYTVPYSPQIVSNANEYNHVNNGHNQGTNVVIQPSTSIHKIHSSPAFSVSNYATDVFKELEQRLHEQPNQFKNVKQQSQYEEKKQQHPQNVNISNKPSKVSETVTSTTVNPKILSQLPNEVPEELREQLFSSGILNNADISVLDYDKIGDTALENLPPEHLQHFYAGGGNAQISESKKVLSVLKPNGEKIPFNEKPVAILKTPTVQLIQQQSDIKLITSDNFQLNNTELNNTDGLVERVYNRYLPIKINSSQFPVPDVDELKKKTIGNVVILAPVEPTRNPIESTELQSNEDSKEVKFLGGDQIKTLIKKPTKDNFKKWIEKEARNDVEQQSIVLLVTKTTESDGEDKKEIYMYDLSNGAVNRLNGELSSAFVNVAEENAKAANLENAAAIDSPSLQNVMENIKR